MYDDYQQTKDVKKRYVWQTEGEVIVWSGRPHIWWLIQPLLILVAIAVLTWLLVQAAPQSLQDAANTFWTVTLGFLGLIACLQW